jgi:hypothetical protein
MPGAPGKPRQFCTGGVFFWVAGFPGRRYLGVGTSTCTPSIPAEVDTQFPMQRWKITQMSQDRL